MYTENEGYDEEEGILAGKFPLMNWSNDNYQVWLNRNAVNIGVGIASGLFSIASGYLGADWNEETGNIEDITGLIPRSR